jgi:SRSO17 transposase
MEPFASCLHHEHQRHGAPFYLRGLIGPGERKSTTCIAQQVAPGEQDQLNHFIAYSPWPVEPAQQLLVAKANALVGGAKAHLIVDDVGWLKKGEHSVGVAPQWCGAAGKKANCQVAVSLTLARRQ